VSSGRWRWSAGSGQGAEPLDSDAVLTELNRVCECAGDATGIRFDIDRNRLSGEQQIDKTRHVYKYRLYFKDMIGGQDHVPISIRVDMTEYDRLYLPVQERQLIHPYSDADACAAIIRCVKLEEALADKLKCLLQRRYCYDLFDLVYGTFIAKDIAVNRAELINVFLRKTIFGSSPSAARALLLDLPFDIYRGWWHKVQMPTASRMSFDAAVEAAGGDTLVVPAAGRRAGSVQCQDRGRVAGVGAAALAGRELQVLHRPGSGGQGPRRDRPVPEPAG
jgi:Nucleotidyl transferase AbiEii toxin, Type IV TA system